VLAQLSRPPVERRRIADVPVGVLLSGGPSDSSLVVALLAGGGGHSTDLQTFSIGFRQRRRTSRGDEFRYSESGGAALRDRSTAASGIGPVGAPVGAAGRRGGDGPEPMVSHDAFAFFLLSEEVAKHVKVVQSGQGADEIFGGYQLVSAADAHQLRGRRICPRVFRRDHGRDGAGARARAT